MGRGISENLRTLLRVGAVRLQVWLRARVMAGVSLGEAINVRVQIRIITLKPES